MAFLFYLRKKGMVRMNEAAREKRNAYMREWRKKNKENVKEINKRYWENKSKINDKGEI